MKPLVSIITPSYNSANFIAETINSVVEQSYPHWELIVIDDKSKDDTCKVVETFTAKHPNIRLIKLDKNAGVANARNIGLAEATGKYIAFLDSDDVWLKEKLAIQVAYMEENNVSMTFCDYKRIDEKGKIISKKIKSPPKISYQKLLWHNLVIFSTSMVRQAAIGDIKLKKVGHEDWAFWLDFFKKNGDGTGINEELALYRVRKGSVSANKFTAINSTWKILRESEKIGLLRSMYLFSKYAVVTVLKRLK